MKKIILIISFFILIFLLGPKIEKPIIFKDLPKIKLSINEVKSWIHQKELKFINIKKAGNIHRPNLFDDSIKLLTPGKL